MAEIWRREIKLPHPGGYEKTIADTCFLFDIQNSCRFLLEPNLGSVVLEFDKKKRFCIVDKKISRDIIWIKYAFYDNWKQYQIIKVSKFQY